MKTSVLVLSTISILIFTANSAFGQNDTINQIDKFNRKQGYWTKSYPNGKKAYEGRFKDDKPIGEFKRYREDGTIKVVLTHNATSTYTQATFFSSDEKIAAQGFYIGKNKDSLWQYYNSNAVLVYEERFQNGNKHGRYKQYYPNGKTYESIPYVNGQMHGTLVQFFPNGLNKTVVNYTNGTQHGNIKVFYEDGKTRVDGLYLNGLKDGEWKFYSDEGQLIETIRYNKGIPENQNQLIEKMNKELDALFKNAGKIQEPSTESFLERMGSSPY